MSETLELRQDKFLFRIPTDRLYSREGIWALPGGDGVTLGLSDYQQQRAGDVAFVELPLEGAIVAAGEELAAVETIKIDVSYASPVAGTVTAVNGELEMEAELINLEPYGRGWMAIIQPVAWERDQAALLGAGAYLALIREELAAEDQS